MPKLPCYNHPKIWLNVILWVWAFCSKLLNLFTQNSNSNQACSSSTCSQWLLHVTPRHLFYSSSQDCGWNVISALKLFQVLLLQSPLSVSTLTSIKLQNHFRCLNLLLLKYAKVSSHLCFSPLGYFGYELRWIKIKDQNDNFSFEKKHVSMDFVGLHLKYLWRYVFSITILNLILLLSRLMNYYKHWRMSICYGRLSIWWWRELL